MENVFQAALHNDVEKIKEYLITGDVNIVDATHSSLLHYAARGNALEVAFLLLENYINLNIVNSKGETPLFEAVSRGELEFCRLLCRYNVDSGIINKMNESIYFKAIIKGRMDILQFLEESLQIDYQFVNENNENALFYALKAYNNNLFFALSEKYPNLIQQRNFNNMSLLMLAIKFDNEEVVDYLLDYFDNYYESDFEHNNVLFYAARYASVDILKRLLSKNPIIAGKNREGLDIFAISALNHHPTTMVLDNYKDSYEYKLYKRSYPFHVAVIERNYDLLDYAMPDIKKKDANGISILDYINYLNDPIIFDIFKVGK